MKSCPVTSIIFLLTILTHAITMAQNTESRSETWFQVYSNIRISDKWGIVADIGHRRKNNFLDTYFQGLFRVGGAYYWKKNSIIAGFAIFQTDGQPEYRPYQRLILRQSLGKFQIQHSCRFEQRFRLNSKTDHFNFNFRTGYQINVQYPLIGNQIKPKTPFLIFQDEIFINFGKGFTNNFFDQNRILIGLGYQFTNTLTMNAGYQYSFTQLPSGADFRHSHSIRLNVLLNIDLRKAIEKHPAKTL